MSMFLLISTERLVHNGSPRRSNLPDAARDWIFNAPAKSASSAELRRQGSNSRGKAHVKVFRACKQYLLAEEHARFDFSLGIYCPDLAMGAIIQLWHCRDQASGAPRVPASVLNGQLQTQPSRSIAFTCIEILLQGHNLGLAGSIQ